MAEAADIRCDVKLEQCVNDPDRFQETSDTAERWAAPHVSSELDQSLTMEAADVWPLMRSAPLVDTKIFNRIISIAQTLENEARPIRTTIKRWQSMGSRPFVGTSRIDKVTENVEMVRQQSRGTLATVRAVCSFNDLLKQLETDAVAVSYDETNIKCEPDSATFDDFFRDWKSGRERSFKERRDEKLKLTHCFICTPPPLLHTAPLSRLPWHRCHG